MHKTYDVSTKIENDLLEWDRFIKDNPDQGIPITDEASSRVKNIATSIEVWLSMYDVSIEVQGLSNGGALLIIDDDKLHKRIIFEVPPDNSKVRFKIITEDNVVEYFWKSGELCEE